MRSNPRWSSYIRWLSSWRTWRKHCQLHRAVGVKILWPIGLPLRLYRRLFCISRQMIDSFCGWGTWEFGMPHERVRAGALLSVPGKLLCLRAVNELWQISRITWSKMGHINGPNCSLAWCELARTNTINMAIRYSKKTLHKHCNKYDKVREVET